MTYFFARTQYPQHTWLNGGQGADARKYWFVYTQRTPNGPRIDAVTSLQSAGDFDQVYSTSTTYYRVQRADDGTAAAILDWTPRQVWHAATEQLLRGGRRGTFKLTAYSDVTGEDREMPCAFGRVTNGTAHFYGNIAQDGAGNVYYGTTESVSQTWRLNPTTEVWTQLANTPSYSQLGSSMEWFPEANSGSGGLIKSLDFATSTLRIILLNAAGDTWSTLNATVPNSQHALLCYHPDHARVLVVGGTNTQAAATFLEADGTATASATACPANVHGMSPAGWVIAHPSGCWMVRSGADLHVYAAWPNDTYDDLTWVDLGSAPDAALTNPTVAVDTARGTYGTALITAESGLYAWALPDISPPGTILVPSGALSLTGYAPSVFSSALISIPAGELSLSAFAPTVQFQSIVQVPAAALNLSAFAPSVATTAAISVSAGSLTLTAYAPTVSDGTGVPTIVSVSLGTLTLTDFAPRVSDGSAPLGPRLDEFPRLPADPYQMGQKVTDLFSKTNTRVNELSTGLLWANYNATAAQPPSSEGSWGDTRRNSRPKELGSPGSQYVVIGWVRLESDWAECRFLTGN